MRGDSVEIFIVQPSPPQNPGTIHFAAFALIVQHELPEHCPALATVEEEGEYIHVATFFPCDLTLPLVVTTMGLGYRCEGDPPRLLCTAIYGLAPISSDEITRIHRGAGVLISVRDWTPTLSGTTLEPTGGAPVEPNSRQPQTEQCTRRRPTRF